MTVSSIVAVVLVLVAVVPVVAIVLVAVRAGRQPGTGSGTMRRHDDGQDAGRPAHLTIEEWLLAQLFDLARSWLPRIRRLLWANLALLFIAIVLVVGVEIRSSRRANSINDTTHKTDVQLSDLSHSVRELKVSVNAIKAVADSVKQAQADTSGADAVREGLHKIDLICAKLGCDHP